MVEVGKGEVMRQSEFRTWAVAIATSIIAFILVVWLVVAGLDEPLTDAWRFPALLMGVMLVIKAYFIRRNNN